MTDQSLGAEATRAVVDRSIGDIIRQANNLSVEQIEQIVEYQRQSGVKFGEAAVSLGLVKREQVVWALSQQYHYPYVSDAPLSSELVVSRIPFSEHAEAFRDLRSQLISTVFGIENRRNALAVLSPTTGAGKTFFAANMAVAFSQLSGRTLLIDADMRTPRLHKVFGIETDQGLSNILAGRGESNVIRPTDELPNLFVLPVGVVPPNPLELVQGVAFSMLLQEVYSKFDYVIVDTPAAAHGSDARVIAAACGAALLVGRKNEARLAPMKNLITAVQKMKATVAGVVINEY